MLTAPSAIFAQRGLTGAPQLARIYNVILDAGFEQVPDLVRNACDPAPAEACQLLGVVSTWWQIELDPHDRSHDAAFRTQADAAIAAVEAWTMREPRRAEAWLYLGAAYTARAQWRALRGERLAAAREGTGIKAALERTLELDPTLQDAYVGIGLYHYYAAVAPVTAKILRWLLLLPGGDRESGLQEVLKAKNGGQLLRDEADYQLHVIYLWYEKQPEHALDLLTSLAARHPRNPHFRRLIGDVQDYRLRDFDASRRTYEELLALALAGKIAVPAMAEAHARLGIARLALPGDAVVQLRMMLDRRPTTPVGVVAQAQLQLGAALDRLDRRTEAATAYRAAIAESLPGDPMKTAETARRAIRASR
jgi:hypothetical protein